MYLSIDYLPKAQEECIMKQNIWIILDESFVKLMSHMDMLAGCAYIKIVQNLKNLLSYEILILLVHKKGSKYLIRLLIQWCY